MNVLIDLLRSYQDGDEAAGRLFVEKAVPSLDRWLRRRLPSWAAEFVESDGLTRQAALAVLPRLRECHASDPAMLESYLRYLVGTHIAGEIRCDVADRARLNEALSRRVRRADLADPQEMKDRYERALATLPDRDREAIVARIEGRKGYDEIAQLTGTSTVNAARLVTFRALGALAALMNLPD